MVILVHIVWQNRAVVTWPSAGHDGTQHLADRGKMIRRSSSRPTRATQDSVSKSKAFQSDDLTQIWVHSCWWLRSLEPRGSHMLGKESIYLWVVCLNLFFNFFFFVTHSLTRLLQLVLSSVALSGLVIIPASTGMTGFYHQAWPKLVCFPLGPAKSLRLHSFPEPEFPTS